MNLKMLPVAPSTNGGENVKAAYVAELQAVTYPESLWEFVKRWLPLYVMTRKTKIDKKGKDAKRFRMTQNSLQSLIDGTWDPKAALVCIEAGKTGLCKHAKQFSCAGMHISAPLALLHADFVAEKYGVTTDIALIQINGGFGALSEY